MTHYLIIDDEPIAHRIIEGYCKELPHLQKTANAYNAFEAMQLLKEHKIDLIFLDINMPKLSGFELLKSLAHPPKVIVTTAYKEFALESYELDVIDYLLKPFSFTRFLKAINKAIDHKDNNRPTSIPNSPTDNPSIFLKSGKKHHQIYLDNILYVEAMGNYCKIYLENEMIVGNDKISALEQLLPSNHFLRVHKSYIVAKAKIKLIEGNRIHIQSHKIPFGQTYKQDVLRLLKA